MKKLLQDKHKFLTILSICCFMFLNHACENPNKSPKLNEIHCNNGLHDTEEKGIDCGGTCPTNCCNNGKFDANLGEKGIDCGGTCKPCTSPTKKPTISPLAQNLEKGLNKLSSENDSEESEKIATTLNTEYKGLQVIIAAGEKKISHNIKDYTMILQLITEKKNIQVIKTKEVDGKLSVVTITEKAITE